MNSKIRPELYAPIDADPDKALTLEDLQSLGTHHPSFLIPAGAKLPIPFPEGDPKITIKQAQIQMQKDADQARSFFCPCCGQQGSVFKYKIRFYAVEALRFLASEWRMLDAKLVGPKGIKMNRHPRLNPKILSDRSYPKLQYWGLIQPVGEGTWKPTLKGLDFVDGKIKIPQSVHIYNGEALAFEGNFISIHDVTPPNT